MDEAGLSQAVDAYRKALFVLPESVDLRSILAVMLETLSEQYRQVNAPEKPRKETHEKLARLQLEINRLRKEELKLVARNVRQLPNSTAPWARVTLQFRYGLTLLLDGRRQKTHNGLLRAT